MAAQGVSPVAEPVDQGAGGRVWDPDTVRAGVFYLTFRLYNSSTVKALHTRSTRYMKGVTAGEMV